MVSTQTWDCVLAYSIFSPLLRLQYVRVCACPAFLSREGFSAFVPPSSTRVELRPCPLCNRRSREWVPFEQMHLGDWAPPSFMTNGTLRVCVAFRGVSSCGLPVSGNRHARFHALSRPPPPFFIIDPSSSGRRIKKETPKKVRLVRGSFVRKKQTTRNPVRIGSNQILRQRPYYVVQGVCENPLWLGDTTISVRQT